MSGETKIDDGGAAFPHPQYPAALGHGMSLRDWFAGQALSNGSMHIADYLTDAELADAVNEAYVLARAAYLIADAMIVAREDGGE